MALWTQRGGCSRRHYFLLCRFVARADGDFIDTWQRWVRVELLLSGEEKDDEKGKKKMMGEKRMGKKEMSKEG